MTETVEAAARPVDGAGASAAGPSSRPLAAWGRDAAVLGAVAVAFVALFVLLREPPFHYDPIEYFFTATRFESATPFHRSLRIGMLGPVRFAQAVLGYSQAAYYTVPLASGLLLLLSTYVLARTVASRSVATASAVLVGFTTPVFATVHQLWPDLPATAVFTAGIAATTVLCKRYGQDGGSPGAWGYAAFVAAGALVGWSYLIREFTAVLFPVVLLPFWQYRTPWRYVLVGAGGALAALGVELGFNARFHGDPLIRIRDLVTVFGEPPPEHTLDIHEARSAQRGGFLERLSVFPDHLTSGPLPVLPAVGAAALASPFLVRRREQQRAVVALLGWLLFYWALVLYLSLDVDEYGRALHIEKIRYWYPAVPPLVVAGCVGAAAGLARLRGARLRQGLGALLVLAIAGSVGVGMVDRAAERGLAQPHAYEQIRRWLATDGATHDSLSTTQRTRWLFEVYTEGPFGEVVWDGRSRSLNTARTFVAQDQLATELLLVDDTFFQARRSNWREVTPPWLLDLSDDWWPVAASDDGEVLVYERAAEALAFAPLTTVWSATDESVTVGADGTAAADVAAGQRTDLNLRIDGGATAGDVVLVETELTTAGNGNVVPYCFMIGADGRTVRSDASTLWGVGFDGPRRVQVACTVPVALAAPVDVRLGLGVTGPMDLDVGPVEQVTVPTGTEWR